MKKGERKVKNLPATVSKELAQQFQDDAKENLKNVNDSFYRISIHGSRYSVNGELIGDKGTEFESIILKEIPVNIYYGKAYDPNETVSPECWSLGGSKPDESSSQKQSSSCVSCKQNKFGTQVGQDGKKRKGKACHNTRRLILKVVGVDMPVMMSLPPTCIKALNHYLRLLTSNNPPIPVFAVKTIFEFDSTVEYPKPTIKQGKLLTPQEYQEIRKYRASEEVLSTLNAYASTEDYSKDENE